MLRFCLVLLLLPLSRALAQDLPVPFCGSRSVPPPAPGHLPRGLARTADQPTGGIYMSASGTLRILLVFASFPDDTTPHPYWPPHGPPLFMQQFIDPDTTTRSENGFNLTAYFRQMSLGRFHLIGDAIWVEAAHPQTDYMKYGSFGLADSLLLRERVDSLVDFARYDNWHRVGDYVSANSPDGLVDMIVMVWRTTIFPFTGEASLGHKRAITLDGKTIAMGFPGSFPDTVGSGVTCEYRYTDDPVLAMHTMVHELGHWLLGAPHPYNSESLSGKHDYWGMICSGHRRASCANAYERERLGWITVPEVTPDAVLPLTDYVTTGAALKYHPAGGEPSEYFYFENHRRLSPFDDPTANAADRGLWVLHQQGPYADLDNIRIEPSDGDWVWDNPGVSSACFPVPLPVFARGVPAPGTGPSHRDMIPTATSDVNWMNVFRDQAGELHCGAFYAGEGFLGSYNAPPSAPSDGDAASVFSPFSNPPSSAWSGQPTGFALEILRDSGDVCVVRSPSAPLATPPARRYLGRDPAAPPHTVTLPLAWGVQWGGGQPLEPDVNWAELVRQVGAGGAWTRVYAGPAMSWADSSLAYDSTGATVVSFRVRVQDAAGRRSAWSNLFTARAAAPGAVSSAPARAPQRFSLEPNFPNPFNPQTSIAFSVPDRSPVRLTVYDLLGRQLRTLASAPFAPGMHSVTWDGRDAAGRPLPSGIYIYRLSSSSHSLSRSMLLVR